MPLQWSHSLFWPGDGVVNATPAAPATYPTWQAVVTTAVVLLAVLGGLPVGMAVVVPLPTPLRPLHARLCKRLRQTLNRYRWLIPGRLWLLWRVWRLTGTDEFRSADTLVREVARTPGLRRTQTDVFSKMGQRGGETENYYRHVLVTEAFCTRGPRRAHVRNLAVELAYTALKERGL